MYHGQVFGPPVTLVMGNRLRCPCASPSIPAG